MLFYNKVVGPRGDYIFSEHRIGVGIRRSRRLDSVGKECLDGFQFLFFGPIQARAHVEILFVILPFAFSIFNSAQVFFEVWRNEILESASPRGKCFELRNW